MANTDINPSNTAGILRRLFEDHLRQQLKAAVQPDIEAMKKLIDQQVDGAIDAAIAELTPVINTHMHAYRNDMLVEIVVKRKEKASG